MVALLLKIEGTCLNGLFNIFRATKFRELQGTAKQFPVVVLSLSLPSTVKASFASCKTINVIPELSSAMLC